MQYFQTFPKILFDFSTDSSTEEFKYVTDFFHRVKISSEIISQTSAYQKYIIKDYETPEIISHKIYGTPYYHWLIIMVNNILNPVTDFPLNSYMFEIYVTKKYGAGNEQLVHHYEDDNGHTITPINIYNVGVNCLYDSINGTWYSINLNDYNAITNYDYEQKLNEAKRVINIIKPEFLGSIVSEFKRLLAE